MQLKQGLNQISVEGEAPCQGIASHIVNLESDILIAPNPFIDKIEIYPKNGQGKQTVTLYTQTGQVVYRETFLDAPYLVFGNLQSLPKGIYYLECSNGTHNDYKKVIKR